MRVILEGGALLVGNVVARSIRQRVFRFLADRPVVRAQAEVGNEPFVLQAIASEYLRQRKEEMVRCEAIVREKARGLFASGGRSAMGSDSKHAFGS